MHPLYIPKRFFIARAYKFSYKGSLNGKHLFGHLERKNSNIVIKIPLMGWFCWGRGKASLP